MGFKVILTPQAQDDLCEIVSFIARHNPQRAKSFGYELIDHALTLGELPERGRIVPEISEPSVREIVHRPYRIIYKVVPVKVQNVIHPVKPFLHLPPEHPARLGLHVRDSVIGGGCVHTNKEHSPAVFIKS